MKNINKIIYLFLMKSSILVGGQAVIEGVMMRVPGSFATAVRLKNSKIKVKKQNFISIVEKYQLNNYFVIRGMFHLFESMKIGYQTLDWSAQMNEEDNKSKKQNKIIDFIMTVFSIFFALSLFFLLPLYFAFYLESFINRPLIFNTISGLIRITIFLIYLLLISQLKDIKRLFQYHGAEHKVVYNFESGEDINIDNAKSFSTLHPRCGTSFVFIIMLVTIFSHAILDSIALLFVNSLTIMFRFFLHIVFLPIVAGIGYEVLKFLAKKQAVWFFHVLSKPGMWLQKITTKEPSEKQLEVSICALQEAFGKDKLKLLIGKKFNADAIG